MRPGVRRPFGIAAIGACALTLGACGSSGLSTSDTAQIRAAVARWMGADTPAQACALLSSGFRFFVGHGDFYGCAADIRRGLGPPRSSQTATIRKISDQAGQVVVDVRISGRGAAEHDLEHPPGPNRFYFVRQQGSWKLNSIGLREGLGPPPPAAHRAPPVKH